MSSDPEPDAEALKASREIVQWTRVRFHNLGTGLKPGVVTLPEAATAPEDTPAVFHVAGLLMLYDAEPRAKLEQAERERDEARALSNKVLCSYCGELSEKKATPGETADMMLIHMQACKAHPLGAAARDVLGLEAALNGERSLVQTLVEALQWSETMIEGARIRWAMDDHDVKVTDEWLEQVRAALQQAKAAGSGT